METSDLARRTPQSHAKRQREQAKIEKRRAKEEKKALRKAEKAGIDLDGDEAQLADNVTEEKHGAQDQPLQRPGAGT